MTSTDHDKPGPDLSSEAAKQMDKYGITCVPSYYYHFGPYRYTNLEDAVAEAKRQAGKS